MSEVWTIEKIKAVRAQLEAPEEEFYHADEFVAESHNMIDFLLSRIEELEVELQQAEESLSRCISFECPSLGPMEIPSVEERKELARKRREMIDGHQQ